MSINGFHHQEIQNWLLLDKLPQISLVFSKMLHQASTECEIQGKYQWLFLVPLIGGRYHIVTQLAIYKWYISGIYCQFGDYI